VPGAVLDPGPGRKFPASFDAVLADAGITVVRAGVRMPRMNAIMERWVHSCRRELLDRTLIWDQRHLPRALREFEAFYNSLIRTRLPDWTSGDASGLTGSSTSTIMPPELHG
jgi:transposase InsO family protein